MNPEAKENVVVSPSGPTLGTLDELHANVCFADIRLFLATISRFRTN